MHHHTLLLKKRLTSVATIAPRAATLEPHVASSCDTAAAPTPATADNDCLGKLSGALSNLIAELQLGRQRTLGDLARESAELGVAIAERLVGTAIAIDRQRLDEVVMALLERIQPTGAVVIHGHPSDLALMQHQIAEHASLHQRQPALAYQPDAGCERGRLKLEAGDLFVEWDTQRCLAEIRDLLLNDVFTEA